MARLMTFQCPRMLQPAACSQPWIGRFAQPVLHPRRPYRQYFWKAYQILSDVTHPKLSAHRGPGPSAHASHPTRTAFHPSTQCLAHLFSPHHPPSNIPPRAPTLVYFPSVSLVHAPIRDYPKARRLPNLLTLNFRLFPVDFLVVAKLSAAQRRHTSSPSLRTPKQPTNPICSPETFPPPTRYKLEQK